MSIGSPTWIFHTGEHMKIQLLLLSCTLLLLAGCPPKPPRPAPVIPLDTDLCPEACEHLRSIPRSPGSDVIGCEEGEDLPDGTSCEMFCIDTQSYGVALKPSCVLTIKHCSELGPVCFQHPE